MPKDGNGTNIMILLYILTNPHRPAGLYVTILTHTSPLSGSKSLRKIFAFEAVLLHTQIKRFTGQPQGRSRFPNAPLVFAQT